MPLLRSHVSGADMANMKFYMTPGSCSTGIHILLEELGVVFEVYLVNLMAGDQDRPEYRALNPKGTIPMLVDPQGRPITDFVAIAYWLARTHSRAGLLPDDLMTEVRVIEVMNHVISTVHMQGFARIFTTDKFSPNEQDYEAIRQRGREIVAEGFAVIAAQLGEEGDYITGDFGIADAALFYVEFWAVHIDVPLPAACEKHYRRMLQRPAVRQVLMEEGYRVD